MQDPLDGPIKCLEVEIEQLKAEISNVRSSVNSAKNTLRLLHADVNKYNLDRGIIGPATEFLDQAGVFPVANEAAEYAEDIVKRGKG